MVPPGETLLLSPQLHVPSERVRQSWIAIALVQAFRTLTSRLVALPQLAPLRVDTVATQ